MVTISEVLKEMVEKGFFDTSKSDKEIIEKLDRRGFKIEGRAVGAVAKQLTVMCQSGVLEREPLQEGIRRYKKI